MKTIKFVRVFALLLALLVVLDAFQDILNLWVLDVENDGDLVWLSVVKGLVGAAFGYGAYVLTTNED